MTVVCGTDLSERSRPGLAAAAAIASALRAPLWVAHVVGESMALLAPDAREQLTAAVRDRLDRETAPAPGGVAVHHAVLEGSPHEALLALARRHEASLVVVSSRGHGDAPRYRVGGTSERIALDAAIPVLVVRDAAPFAAWARGERALRVVVGVDFGASAAAAVRWTRALAAAGPCDVAFAHAYDPAEARDRYAGDDPSDAGTPEQLLQRDVAELVGPFPGLGSHAVRLRAGAASPAEALLDVARDERADVIVLGTRRRRGPARLWSVSSGVLHVAPVSVAIVPTPTGGVEPEVTHRVRSILVAADLGLASDAAIPVAFGLAGRGATVHVLHVLPPREHPDPHADALVTEGLQRLVPPGTATRGVSAETHVVHGEPARAICDLAERLGVDVVCLPPRTHGLARVMGSVVADVLEASRRPVLVVRAPPG